MEDMWCAHLTLAQRATPAHRDLQPRPVARRRAGPHGQSGRGDARARSLRRDEAVSFRNAFCQNPVCTPSRCSFMTGWYPHVRGHRTMFHMLHPERGEPVLLKTLKDTGYFVWWGGKNDLTPARTARRVLRREVRAHRAAAGRCAELDHERRVARRAGQRYLLLVLRRPARNGARGSLSTTTTGRNVLGAIDLIRTYDGDRAALHLPAADLSASALWRGGAVVQHDRPRGAAADACPRPTDWAGKPSLLKGIWRAPAPARRGPRNAGPSCAPTYYGMCARVDHQFGC